MALKLTAKLTSVLAAATSLALAAAPAFAGPPYTVSGSAETFTASGQTVFTAGSQTWTCTDSSLTLTPHTGLHSTGDDLADVTAASWTNCLWLGGIDWNATVTSTSWALSLDSGGNTNGLSDDFTGSLTNISNITWTISATGCSFNVNGSLDVSFDEDNGAGGQELGVTGSHLSVANVNSVFACLGLVSNGQSMTLFGTYETSGQGINIS